MVLRTTRPGNALRAALVSAPLALLTACAGQPQPHSAANLGASQGAPTATKPTNTQAQSCLISDNDKKIGDLVGQDNAEKIAMAYDAAGVGTDFLIPPGAGALSAGLGGLEDAYKAKEQGHIGTAAIDVASALPAAAAGFFGGGSAGDFVQGATNKLLRVVGVKGDLPDSSIADFAEDVSCRDQSGATKKASATGLGKKQVVRKSNGPTA